MTALRLSDTRGLPCPVNLFLGVNARYIGPSAMPDNFDSRTPLFEVVRQRASNARVRISPSLRLI